jgi:curli biogenesis system outer membrane secretion channel CsgG
MMLRPIATFACLALLAGCASSPAETDATNAAAEQTCLSAVTAKTGQSDVSVDRSQTDWGASLVVVQAGSSLYRCKFSGGIIKDVSSVAR